MQTEYNQHQAKASLLLIRHADSEYNSAQKQAMNSKTEVPDRFQNQTVKWSTKYLDCGISEIGKKQVYLHCVLFLNQQQCEAQEAEIQQYDVDYVFSSPMRRCLETTYNLFKNHPSKPTIIVLPFLREEIQSSCDIGSKVLESKKIYPSFDFSFLETLFVDPNIWFVETIYNKEKQTKILDKIKSQCKTEEDYSNFSSQIMIEFMKESFPDTIETKQEMAQRATEIKTNLLPKALREISLDKQVAVVAHSQLLYNFTAESFDDNFQGMGTLWFSNCEIRPFEIEL